MILGDLKDRQQAMPISLHALLLEAASPTKDVELKDVHGELIFRELMQR